MSEASRPIDNGEITGSFQFDEWQLYAACLGKDPNIFFPNDGAGVAAAQSICALCIVKEPCLEYALTTRQLHGVWGGASERERGRIMRQRRNARE